MNVTAVTEHVIELNDENAEKLGVLEEWKKLTGEMHSRDKDLLWLHGLMTSGHCDESLRMMEKIEDNFDLSMISFSYIPDNVENPEGVTPGKIYLAINEDELYHKIELPPMESFNEAGLDPTESSWVEIHKS